MSTILRLLLPFLLGFASLTERAAAASEDDLLPVEEAFRIEAQAGSADNVQFRFTVAEGYYLYRHRFAVQLVGATETLPEFSIPAGTHYVDEFFGEVETYRERVTLTQALPEGLARAGQTLRFELRFQGCADLGICYPPTRRTVSVALPAPAPGPAAGSFAFGQSAPVGLAIGSQPPGLPGFASDASQQALPEDEAFRLEAIATSSDRLLLRFSIAPGYYLYRDNTRLSSSTRGLRLATPAWPAAQAHEDAHFGAVQVYFQSFEASVDVLRDDEAATRLGIEAEYQGCKDQGICYPVMRRSLELAIPAGPGAAPESIPASAMLTDQGALPGAGIGLWTALLGALLGGLILNLMPCVLPILSLKAIGLAQSGHSQSYARRHAIWYTIGVLFSFLALGAAVLALRAGGSALGWGFQLQQPVFVGILVYLMLAIGLSLSGLVAFGASWGGLGQSLTEDEGSRGAFFTGVLATVVASPCTAPFMAGALSFAVTQPPLLGLLVFFLLGLGLALPFLLIGFVPALAARLPRPGPWMETFKQTMAFPMYLTGVWLFWVLGHQVGMDGAGALLAGGVALAMALWWWERQRHARRARRLLPTFLLIALALWPLHFVAGLDAPAKRAGTSEDVSQVYSEQRLAELRAGGTPVFVNMTADWCATCKLNERLVLSSERFRKALQATGTVYLKGDWTNEDPEISAFLQRFRAVGVPLYVVFPATVGPGKVLPTLLDIDTVERALGAGDDRQP